MEPQTESKRLSPEEILYIFQEEHRLYSPWDEDADPFVELTMDTFICDWQDSSNLLPWEELSRYLNEYFAIHIPRQKWKTCLTPVHEKQLKGVCKLISRYVYIEEAIPINVFGQKCLSASLFYQIKNSLSQKGVNTTSLSPSSLIEPYLKASPGVLLNMINKNYPGSLPEIKITETKYNQFQKYCWSGLLITFIGGFIWHHLWWSSLLFLLVSWYCYYKDRREIRQNNGMVYIPGILTFRDLINSIIQNKDKRW